MNDIQLIENRGVAALHVLFAVYLRRELILFEMPNNSTTITKNGVHHTYEQ
jgi:hypothetical protein